MECKDYSYLSADVSVIPKINWYEQLNVKFYRFFIYFLELNQQLLLVFDKQRRAVFREAFWITERPIDKCCIRTPVAVLEHYKSIIKVDYLKKLPRCTIFCEETDCPGEYWLVNVQNYKEN